MKGDFGRPLGIVGKSLVVGLNEDDKQNKQTTFLYKYISDLCQWIFIVIFKDTSLIMIKCNLTSCKIC